MSTVYLAWSSAAHETLVRHAADAPVDLLVAFPVLVQFLRKRREYNVRRWCLDSGAFSAHNSGLVIDRREYIAACRDVDAFEVFGLDVIGDPDATRVNLEAMWAAGVPAIPTYHYGSPEAWLTWCAQAHKVALGGVARIGDRKRERWLGQCVARLWPKRVHGFGCASMRAVMAAPFDSVDASSWVYAPSAMGHWAGYTGTQVWLRSRGQKDFWIEVVEHQRRARLAAHRWRAELGLLDATQPVHARLDAPEGVAGAGHLGEPPLERGT